MSRMRMSLLGDEGCNDVEIETVTEPGVDNLESSILDVNESTDEGESIEAAVDEGVEIHDALGDLQEDLQVAQESGGLDKGGARIAGRYLAFLLSRAGHRKPDGVFPALESFGTTGSRQQATRLGLEGIGQTMKDLWKRIVAMIQKAYDWCYKHVIQLLGAAKKLKDRAEKLSQRASNVDTGDKFDTAAIENDGLSKRLSLNGAVTATAGVAALKEAVDTYVTKWEETSKGASTALLGALEKVSEAIASSDAGKLNALSAAVKATGDEVGKIKVISGSKEEKIDGATRNVANLPGGVSVVVSIPTVAGEMTKSDAKKLRIGLEPTKAFKSVKSFPPLKADAAGTLCDAISALAGSMEDFAKIEPAIKRYEASVVKAGDTLTKSTVTDDQGKTNPAARAVVQAVGTLVVQVAPSFGTFPVKVMNAAIAGGKAHLDWVELSLGHYSKDTTAA